MTAPAVELRGVTLGFRGLPVLESVDLTVETNGYLAILGPNGGGKTMLLKVMLGLLKPDRGRVRVLGEPPTRTRGRVGYVPQRARFDLDFPMRVLDVVLMGRLGRDRLWRRFDARDREVAHQKLAQVEMEAAADRAIGALSGGELQRVLIARALALDPELLLLDEPTASLDERIGPGVWDLLEALTREMTIVVVSHDIGAISRHVKSVACLNRRLHAHPTRELTAEMLEATYGCPVDLLAHGQPHRVLREHAAPGED